MSEILQLMLQAVVGPGGGAATIERETGTRLHVRGNEVMIEGEQSELVARLLRQLYALARAGNPVEASDVGRALEVLRHDAEVELREVFEDVILVRPSDGKGIMPRSLAQKRYVASMRRHTLTFGVGPAGTGKTYLAVAMAARALMDKQVRRIVLSRPAIEAGERLGFLPGTLEDKISPYLRPLYDALYEMFAPDKVMRMLEQTVLEIAPLAYMRGRTLNDAFVILDEAQNTTREQMKMFLTRIGTNTRAVVTGDPSQVDLPGGQRSGLAHALRLLRGVEGIAICRFSKSDVMRHPLVQAIIEAYDEDAKRRNSGPHPVVPPRDGKRPPDAEAWNAMAHRKEHRRAKARSAPPLGDPDPVLDVMVRELGRSMEGFDVPGSPRPYFMGYTLRRERSLQLRAAYGSLLRRRETMRARLYCEVRVGDHHFDNVMDAGLDVDADARESTDWVDAPDDLDPVALQVALWKLGQIKLDEALEDYYDHKKALVSEYLRDEVDAFTKEPPLSHREALHDEPLPRERWEAMLREASRVFLSHPEFHDPTISLTVDRHQRWLATTEGTRVITENVYCHVDVGGWILTEDGVYTEATQQRYTRSIDAVPDAEGLAAMVDQVLRDLASLRDAETPGAFIGPALLAGQAASTLFHEALGHRLEGDRLVARGETRTFAHKVGKRILPAGLDVYDDPTLADAQGHPVWGGYRVDDQGVPAQRARLVEDGVLRGFLHGRTPTRHSRRSNGHGRHDGLSAPMSRMAHLVVEGRPDRSLSWDQLEQRLLELARAQGRAEAIVIIRVHGGETATSSYDFQVFKGEPAEVWALDAETGERRRLRDVELIGTPLAAMQRVVAFGGDPQVDEGYCYAESGSIPVSGACPALLLSEIELQQRSSTGFHEPLLPPPFADDGSRGRTMDERKRGRRRKR